MSGTSLFIIGSDSHTFCFQLRLTAMPRNSLFPFLSHTSKVAVLVSHILLSTSLDFDATHFTVSFVLPLSTFTYNMIFSPLDRVSREWIFHARVAKRSTLYYT